MADPLRIVVAAHARSGSNTLVEVLDCSPSITMLNEPFNERFAEWSPDGRTYLDRVHDAASLDAVLDEIFDRYTGIKLLMYQLDPQLRSRLLLRPDVHVITLRRRNLLEAAVSNLIALQTDYWKREVATGSIEDRYRALRPVPVESAREIMGWHQVEIAEADAIARQRTDGRVLELVYEDLHLAPPAEQGRVLDRLWSFLGVEPPDDPRLRLVLDPGEVRQAGAATYGQLPNLREIDEALGSDETGRLTYLD